MFIRNFAALCLIVVSFMWNQETLGMETHVAGFPTNQDQVTDMRVSITCNNIAFKDKVWDYSQGVTNADLQADSIRLLSQNDILLEQLLYKAEDNTLTLTGKRNGESTVLWSSSTYSNFCCINREKRRNFAENAYQEIMNRLQNKIKVHAKDAAVGENIQLQFNENYSFEHLAHLIAASCAKVLSMGRNNTIC